MADISPEEAQKLAQDLVYQVAYAFYDVPYIILLKLVILREVYARYTTLLTPG